MGFGGGKKPEQKKSPDQRAIQAKASKDARETSRKRKQRRTRTVLGGTEGVAGDRVTSVLGG